MPGLSEAERERLAAWAERWELTPANMLRQSFAAPTAREWRAFFAGMMTATLLLATCLCIIARASPSHDARAEDARLHGVYSGADATGRTPPVDP